MKAYLVFFLSILMLGCERPNLAFERLLVDKTGTVKTTKHNPLYFVQPYKDGLVGLDYFAKNIVFTENQRDEGANRNILFEPKFGDGPYEIHSISSFTILNNILFYIETNAFKVVGFDLEAKEYVFEENLEDRPSEVVTFNDELVIVYFGSDILLESFTYENGDLTKTHTISTKSVMGVKGSTNPFTCYASPLVLQDQLLLAHRHFANGYVFDIDYELIKTVTLATVNGEYLHTSKSEKPTKAGNNIIYSGADTKMRLDGMYFDPETDQVAIASNELTDQEPKKRRFIDIYTSDLNYQYSIELSEYVILSLFSDNVLHYSFPKTGENWALPIQSN